MIFFKKKAKAKTEDLISFKEKLRFFQNLLNSNDEALKQMGSLSELLVSGEPFSKGEIYKIFSDILVNTKEVTKNLSSMCSGKYKSLINYVNRIQDRCNEIIAPGSYCSVKNECDETNCLDCEKVETEVLDSTKFPYAYQVDEITMDHTREVGGKMSRLCEIHNKLVNPYSRWLQYYHQVF